MGYYNDLVIQIRKKDQKKFEDYLDSDYEKNGRVLDTSYELKESGEYLVYIWMNDHQLRVSAHNRNFNIEFEMETRAEFEPEDYVAEMWTEDNEYVRAGYLDVTYMVSMNAFVYDEDERKWI